MSVLDDKSLRDSLDSDFRDWLKSFIFEAGYTLCVEVFSMVDEGDLYYDYFLNDYSPKEALEDLLKE